MRTPKECAEVLAAIFNDGFAGTSSEKYRISRQDLKNITGRPVWHQTIIEDVADWMVEMGLILIDRDEFFYVMKPTDLENIRDVTQQVLTKHNYPVSFGYSSNKK